MDTNKSFIGWVGTYLPPSLAMWMVAGSDMSGLVAFGIGAIAGMASISAYYHL